MSRALLATVGVDDAVVITVTQFGWDAAFLAFAETDSDDSAQALWSATELLCDELPAQSSRAED